MKLLNIPRPDWHNLITEDGKSDFNEISHAPFNNWFDTHVTPEVTRVNDIIRSGTTVFCADKSTGEAQDPCYWKYWDDKGDTHKALLIDPQLIKKETREEKLEAVLRDLISDGVPNDFTKGYVINFTAGAYRRVKEVLESGGGE